MSIIDFIRLVRRHLVLLIVVPLLLALIVIKLTGKKSHSYTSHTVLYTGLATGSSIEMDKSFNYFATNTAFDNLINIVNSRETQQEVAIRLLSQHLLLGQADPKYISSASYAGLKKITPAYIYQYVVRDPIVTKPATDSATTKEKKNSDSVIAEPRPALFPASINPLAYEITVKNLTQLMKSSDTNFVYKLLNFEHPHYSIKAISGIKAQRIASSDLIKLSYEVNDPGICQQTLAIFNEVCIHNYKNIKENRSDEVVKYFQTQLSSANQQLRSAEDKLLSFNKANNIINYYEQSKAVAVVKEDMEVDYNNKKAQLAGHEASIKRLEEKLNIQQLVQLKSGQVLDKKKQLGDINYDIANAEAEAESNPASKSSLPELRKKAESLKSDIKRTVDDLYGYQHSVDGLPLSKTLSEWLNNTIEAENLKAKLLVMDQRNRDFQQQYAIYAPAGAQIKRIEREINVSEQGYLELLHGLNLAKLKLQDNELASDLKTVDAPYYPISPVPSNRKVLVIAAALLGAILLMGIILLMEYFDQTLKNSKRAVKKLNIPTLGMLARVYKRPGIAGFGQLQQRLLELITQHMQQGLATTGTGAATKTVAVISTTGKEGKSVLSGNMAQELKRQGNEVCMIDFSEKKEVPPVKDRNPWMYRMLGYQDPRIDHSSSFLAHPETYLGSTGYFRYSPDLSFLQAQNYQEILAKHDVQLPANPAYVFMEMPALLNNHYSPGLLASADLVILVCRSNRVWSEADQAILDTIVKPGDPRIRFVLTGVDLQETESLLGELPKKRSVIRKKIKELFRFQVHAKKGF